MAVLRSDDSSARSSADPNPSSHAITTPPYILPPVHAYLADTSDKGKGKGETILHREPWNRRARRVYQGDDVARPRSASPASSDHASMPELDASDDGEQEIIEA